MCRGGPAWGVRGGLASQPPSTAIEVAAGRVTAVHLGDGGRTVSAHATEPLGAGVLAPTLNAPNVHDQAGLAGAIKSVLDRLGTRVRRIALVLPDTIAKVSLVRFEKVPQKAQDLEQLIRWQVRKAAPFRIEDAQVSWYSGITPPGGGREYIVTVARRDIIEGYERACDAAGAHAGLVDIATPNVINAALATGDVPADVDWLMVHVAPDYATLAVVRGSALVFFRNRAAAEAGDLADLVHQTAMYHEDRLGGGGFARVILAGASSRGGGEAERLRRTIEERIGVRVEAMDFRNAAAISDRIGAGADLLDALAPSVGVLLRDRAAARTGRVA